MKNALLSSLFAGLFLIVFSGTVKAQSEIIPVADKNALTIACEVCTVMQSNKPLSEVQKNYQTKLNATQLKWCPAVCTLLAKVNSGNRLNSKEYDKVTKVRRAIQSSNDGSAHPTIKD